MSTLDIRRPRPQLAEVWLDRPQLRNAFDEQLIAELTQTIDALGADPQVRVIVLGGHGKAFCAGADLNWMRRMAEYDHAQNLADARGLARMLATLDACPKPTIARVHGDAFAGGLGLLAACDIAVGVPAARLCLSEVKLGLIPATIAPYVIRAMGQRAAQRWFLTAEVFSADAAWSMGLLHEVVAPAELDATIERLVAQLLQASPHALAECKRLLRDVGGRPVDAALVEDTAQRIAAIRQSPEARDGVAAFLNKGRPSYAVEPPAASPQA